eukprot:5356076-Prymnesium_polylepis.1
MLMQRAAAKEGRGRRPSERGRAWCAPRAGGGHRWLPRHADGAGVLPSDQDALDELQLVVASRVRPALGDGHHSVSAADGHFDAAAARGQGAHPAALPHQRDGRAARVDVDAQPGDVALQPVRRVLHPAWPHRLGG